MNIYRAEAGADGTIDNVGAAVLAQLGHHVDSDEDENENVFDDTDSNEDDDGTDSNEDENEVVLELEAFSFYQISVGSQGVTNDVKSGEIPGA